MSSFGRRVKTIRWTIRTEMGWEWRRGQANPHFQWCIHLAGFTKLAAPSTQQARAIDHISEVDEPFRLRTVSLTTRRACSGDAFGQTRVQRPICMSCGLRRRGYSFPFSVGQAA